MSSGKSLIKRMQNILEERSREAFEIAKQTMLQEKIEFMPIREALHYFLEEIWFDEMHPGLISLACEAVGGNPTVTKRLGAAMVLLAGSADIHDDIIDQSKTKNKKSTVFGKFGSDIAILVGDALLVEGIYLIHESCEQLPRNRKKLVLSIVKEAFFEMSDAEAKETSLKGRFDISPEEYLSIIERKVVVAEATMKMGAVFGGGTLREIESFGHYGKTLGILMTIRDEFIDIFEPEELQNRFEKGCLPLPVLFAFKDSDKKDEIILLLKKERLTKEDVDQIVEIVMESRWVHALKRKMSELVEAESHSLDFLRKHRIVLKLLLQAMLQGLR
jgi:geranylgeranyl pyrophosphate synthase